MYRISVFLLMLLISSLCGQDIKPVTTEIRYEVLDELIDVDQEEQALNIQVTSLTLTGIKYLSIGFEKIPARWSLISAELNGEKLWLVKADIHPGNDKVLAWDYSPGSNQIRLFPHTWQAPYVLDLQMQLNFESRVDSQETSDERVLVEAELSGTAFLATPTGRGDKINFR
jgi:hypothetical protein